MKIYIGSLAAVMPYLPQLEHVADTSGGAVMIDAGGVSFYQETKEDAATVVERLSQVIDFPRCRARPDVVRQAA
jgi:hypothetical protein